MMGQSFQKKLMAPQTASHPRTQDFPHQSANQASFTANFLEIQNQGQVKEGSVSVTSFAPPDFIIKEKKELSSLGGEENLDQFHLNRYIKVLQARSKEMSLGKEQMDWLITTFSAKKMCSAPKVQAHTSKLLLSTFVSSDHTSIPQSTNMAPVKSKVHVSNVIGQVLSAKFVSWSKSYWL